MVLMAAQMQGFFEGADQMGIPHDTVIQLVHWKELQLLTI